MIKNNQNGYGYIAIGLHWGMAILLIAIFSLGLWMVDLDYYHDWYHRAPHWHRGLGSIFLLLVFVRLTWRLLNTVPAYESSLSSVEHHLATWMHRILYLIMLCLPVSGYLLSTSDGSPLDVFGLFEIPATLTVDNSDDLVSELHEVLAFSLIALAVFHAIAALKHHFIDRDQTLLKMLGRYKKSN